MKQQKKAIYSSAIRIRFSGVRNCVGLFTPRSTGRIRLLRTHEIAAAKGGEEVYKGERKGAGPEVKWVRYIVGVFLVFVMIYLVQDILIPLSFALLISFILYPVCTWFEAKGLPRLVSILLCLFLLLMLGAGVVTLLLHQLIGFVNELPVLQEKLQASVKELSLFLTNSLGISSNKQDSILQEVITQLSGSAVGFLKGFISTSILSLVMLILIPVYVILLLYYRSYWMEILGRIFPGERKAELYNMMHLTIRAYYQFIKGMALVYLTVGILNSIGLVLLGVPHPFLFGFVASVLTFVPYLGIIAGSLLPMAIAWITFDSLVYPLGVMVVFAFVQYLEANLIFPFAVSQKLNVNALVMLLAIFLGGLLWGISGMILFVPFTGMLKLIADHNPRWKTMSMILGVDRRGIK